MRLIFENKQEYCSGFVSDNVEEKENRIEKSFSESELNELIPDSFEETDWKEVRRHYKLDDSGNIVFDEGYEPETEDEE